MRRVTTVILAGGRGSRLDPLTRDRAKPAVPFGGLYRIIDFTLSNCLNSGLRHILLLTQYKARSLDRHIRQGWSFLSPELGEGVEVLPPQQRIDEHWYKGTADAIYQNIYSLEKEDSELTLILAGDHIYKMDYGEMLAFHTDRGADLTIGCIPVPLAEVNQFGIIETDERHRVERFIEKPPTARPMPGDAAHALGSMGIYVFSTRHLFELLCEDAARPESEHDFGKDIIPRMIAEVQGVYAYRFHDKNAKPKAYWRDVGTIDAFYQANMDLIAVEPELNLYDPNWPVRTFQPQSPPPKFVFSDDGPAGNVRRGHALDSIVCQGCILSGGVVRNSVLSPRVRVNSFAQVDESIIFEGVDIGRHCRIRRAIIDKDSRIPPHTVVGYDAELDRRRGFTVSEGGVVVIPKGERGESFAGG